MLVHVRDPLSVLQQACSVARETVIVAEGSFESDMPIAVFLGGQSRGSNSWWHLSNALYREAFKMFGFKLEQVSRADYICNHSDRERLQQVWTFVAQRRG